MCTSIIPPRTSALRLCGHVLLVVLAPFLGRAFKQCSDLVLFRVLDHHAARRPAGVLLLRLVRVVGFIAAQVGQRPRPGFMFWLYKLRLVSFYLIFFSLGFASLAKIRPHRCI